MAEVLFDRQLVDEVSREDRLFGDYLKKMRNTVGSSAGHLGDFARDHVGYVKLLRDAVSGDTYIARLPREIVDKLKTGEYERIYRKGTDLFTGLIRTRDGSEIRAQVAWEKVSRPDVVTNLSQIAVQAQLAEISRQLCEVDKKVDLVLQGQQNDRISKVQAGMSLYKNAQNTDDPQRRDSQLANSLQSLTEGRNALIRDLGSRLLTEKREFTPWDKIAYLGGWGVDLPAGELHEQIEKNQDAVKESLYYIGLSFVYAVRANILCNECKSAQDLMSEYEEFCALVADRVLTPQSPYPSTIIDIVQQQQQVRKNILPRDAGVVLELPRGDS